MKRAYRRTAYKLAYRVLVSGRCVYTNLDIEEASEARERLSWSFRNVTLELAI